MENRTDIYVDTGSVGILTDSGSLQAVALGSCVAVTAFDPALSAAGMAHVMLPGTCPDPDAPHRTRYAADALEALLNRLRELGTDPADLDICLVGGANVLEPDHPGPGPAILDSIQSLLKARNLSPAVVEGGGTQRRSCTLRLPGGVVSCTAGDASPRILRAGHDVRQSDRRVP